MKFPGSFAIELVSEINLKVYRIEDGEDSLEENIRLDPKDFRVVYVTPVIPSDGQSRVVIYATGSAGKDRSWTLKTGEFMAMGCNPWVGGIDRRLRPGEEVFLFALSMSLTPDGTPVTGSVQAMKAESRSHKSAFLAFTCEAIQ
ncbi:hypothetical protein [Luteolibacter soli]|uniref:Uncharacterized protein n=1 Tax=Luteolibacter soli TaxID=3135280 RepID=A0ABU9B1T6_9BACT